ncbi:MAG TPA: preprotein translocase subunit SecG [Pirellulales bacterium]|nr:preprotein translocase subunit SecG [Pirellulales bacterium]
MVFLIQFLMFVTALFLIVLILLQRGRGGGLAGALGGMGGQSAFGSKAGDMFTKITSGVAIFWILLCIGSLKYMSSTVNRFDQTAGGGATAAQGAPLEPEAGGDAADGKKSASPKGPAGEPAEND